MAINKVLMTLFKFVFIFPADFFKIALKKCPASQSIWHTLIVPPLSGRDHYYPEQMPTHTWSYELDTVVPEHKSTGVHNCWTHSPFAEL